MPVILFEKTRGAPELRLQFPKVNKLRKPTSGSRLIFVNRGHDNGPDQAIAGPLRGTTVAKRSAMSVLPLLQRNPLLRGGDPKTLAELVRVATTRELHYGHRLWDAGDTPQFFTVIRAGLVKIVRPVAKGKMAICGLFGPPEAVGAAAIFRNIPYPADAVVVTRTAQFVLIPCSDVQQAIRSCPELALSATAGLHTKLSALHDKIDILSAGSVEGRLATLLLKLYRQFGDDFDDGTARIPIVLSRRELSELVSTSFETAIRVMTRWERAGTVKTERDGFVLYDLALLEAIGSGEQPSAAE